MKILTNKTKFKFARNKTKKLSHKSIKSKTNDELNKSMSLENLIALWTKYHQHQQYDDGLERIHSYGDPEIEHPLEDEILIKYILEVENGTIRGKNIIKFSRLIKTQILDKERIKWYAG